MTIAGGFSRTRGKGYDAQGVEGSVSSRKCITLAALGWYLYQ